MPLFATQRFCLLISITKHLLQARDTVVSVAQTCCFRRPRAKPAAESSPHRTIIIPHNNRSLEAIFSTPAAPSSAILIFHGIGDRLIYWQSVQHLLAAHNIASLIFHYSGYGKSTGATTPRNLQQDAHAAYASLRSLLPEATPIYLLGFSLGSGVVVDAAPHLLPPPAGLILCQSFTSLQAAAGHCAPQFLTHLLPDIWQTHRAIANIFLPLLIVHSDADQLFPSAMARQIEAAARTRSNHTVDLIQPKGFAHNDLYLRPALGYWQSIIDFTQCLPSPHKTS
jgi:uncharacterized protein